MMDASVLSDQEEEQIVALARQLYEASGGQNWSRVSDAHRDRWCKQAAYVRQHMHCHIQPLRDDLLDIIEGLIPAAAKGVSMCRGGTRLRAEAAINRGKEHLK